MMQALLAQNQQWWDHMSGWGWGMMIFGWLFTVALIALVAWAIWSVTRRRDFGTRSRPADILAERYARGEIGRDEYLERRADLG